MQLHVLHPKRPCFTMEYYSFANSRNFLQEFTCTLSHTTNLLRQCDRIFDACRIMHSKKYTSATAHLRRKDPFISSQFPALSSAPGVRCMAAQNETFSSFVFQLGVRFSHFHFITLRGYCQRIFFYDIDTMLVLKMAMENYEEFPSHPLFASNS